MCPNESAAMTADPGRDVLSAQGISLGYGADAAVLRWVLRDFSLTLRAGELVVLLGASGVGKSSLLRVLAGLQSAQRGQLSLFGRPQQGPHPRVSFVFQDPCLLPWLKLEQNVGFGLDFSHQPTLTRGQKQARVAAAIAEVGLSDARNHYPAELSGGMAQRVALARAMARQPALLLLDEPFSALDEITRSDMQQLLLQLTARHHTAAIMVTHNIDEALNLADRILLIGGQPGRLLQAWHVALAHPRDAASAEQAHTRHEIVRAMRDASLAPAVA